MAWVREKNPKRKIAVQQRDPKEALEGLLSYLACKPAPGTNIPRYLRETSPHRYEHNPPEIVQRDPTIYNPPVYNPTVRSPTVRNPTVHNPTVYSPTVYDEEEDQNEEVEEDYEPEPVRNPRRRIHQHHHHHYPPELETQTVRTTPAPRHVSSGERGSYRPRTSVQTRRVQSSWSNATTALII